MEGELNGHVGKYAFGYEAVHGRNGYERRNPQGERILQFGDALNMVIRNRLFKKESNDSSHRSQLGGRVSQTDYRG